MDAKELTKKTYDLENRIIDLEAKIDFIEQEYRKQRMFIEDMKMDIKQLEFMGRTR